MASNYYYPFNSFMWKGSVISNGLNLKPKAYVTIALVNEFKNPFGRMAVGYNKYECDQFNYEWMLFEALNGPVQPDIVHVFVDER